MDILHRIPTDGNDLAYTRWRTSYVFCNGSPFPPSPLLLSLPSLHSLSILLVQGPNKVYVQSAIQLMLGIDSVKMVRVAEVRRAASTVGAVIVVEAVRRMGPETCQWTQATFTASTSSGGQRESELLMSWWPKPHLPWTTTKFCLLLRWKRDAGAGGRPSSRSTTTCRWRIQSTASDPWQCYCLHSSTLFTITLL